MKLTHQFKDQNVELALNQSIPLGFFFSNKIGGMMFFDAKKDCTQYYARVNDSTLKVIHDIKFEGFVLGVKNNISSIDVSREIQDYNFFVPHYMNAMILTSTKDTPIEIIFDHMCVDNHMSMDVHSIYAKDGRIIIKSMNQGNEIFTALQGHNLFYEQKKNDNLLSLNIMSPNVSIAVAGSENQAIMEVNHLFHNASKIQSVQERYVSTGVRFIDPEASLAYACVLNGLDHMLIPHKYEKNTVVPLPEFSKVNNLHISIAMHAMIIEGEFGIAKNILLKEINNQQDRIDSGTSRFEEAAWSMVMTGRLMNNLCTHKKLYSYFSPVEVKMLAEKIAYMTKLLEKKYLVGGFIREGDEDTKIEYQAIMLSLYSLSFSMTKINMFNHAEQKLKEKTLRFVKDIFVKVNKTGVQFQDVLSVFMTAYVYPVLMSKNSWKECFDMLLDKMHNNFGTLKRKMLYGAQTRTFFEIELFGLASMAATVLNKTDSEHYKNQINDLLKMTISEVLCGGIIGRPTSSFNQSINPEYKSIIHNTHLLNNTLFLEMIRECV